MSAPAVIQGTYADYRRVKGRKVLQLVVEVPIEMAPQVHSIFGEPSPDGSTWVAVALLDPTKARAQSPVEPASQPSEKPASGRNGGGAKGGRRAREAGIACGDVRFWKHLEEKRGIHIVDATDCADYVRAACGVDSRTLLDHNGTAARTWDELYAEYLAEMA